MKRQQYLQHRLQTLSALRDAVGAMRSLSAHHFRRARQALPAAREYRTEMNRIVGEIGIHQHLQPGVAAGLLLITSDLGLCGDYNSQLAQLAIHESDKRPVKTLYLIGHRACAALAKHALVPSRTYDAPASLEGLSHILLRLAQDVLTDYGESRIGSLHVVSAGFEGVGHFSPLSMQLLPIAAVAGTAPLRRSPFVDTNHLAMVAVREYLYITLYEILLDALAAEHGMRLMAAESALEWLDNTSTTTARRLASARSEAATQELLDIVTGGHQKLRLESS